MRQRYRIYQDKNTGLMRKIRYVMTKPYLVDFVIDGGPSQADVWELEDGSHVQIPTDAWTLFFGTGDEIAEIYE